MSGNLGVTGGARVAVETGTDDGLGRTIFAYALDPLFAPSARGYEVARGVVIVVDMGVVLGVWGSN